MSAWLTFTRLGAPSTSAGFEPVGDSTFLAITPPGAGQQIVRGEVPILALSEWLLKRICQGFKSGRKTWGQTGRTQSSNS
jgi:hypothetical protein